jgi:hypothetical protein
MLGIAGRDAPPIPKDPNLVPALQQDASRQGLSALVPPGQYTSLTFQIAAMLTVEVPPAKSRGQLHVVGWQEVDLRVDAPDATVSAAEIPLPPRDRAQRD